MRTKATSIDSSTLQIYDGITPSGLVTYSGFGDAGANSCWVAFNGTGFTQYRPYQLLANNSASAYIGASAEL
jgi:hypothetical protein